MHLAGYRDDAYLAQHTYALGEQYINVEGLKLCYQEGGEGDTVLILPGLGTTVDFWQLNIPEIAKHFHVVTVDLPGFGKSSKPDVAYELSWIAERILAFMDAKGVQRASIIGGSMGGHLGLLLALDHPGRVDKLVLMGSSGIWPRPGVLMDLALRTLWNDTIVTDHVRRNWPGIFKKMFKYETPVTEGLFRYQMAVRVVGEHFAPEGRACSRALRSIFYNSCRDRLRDVRQPVLLIWGALDHVHPPEDAGLFRERLPQSRLVVVPDAAHEVMVDQPDVFNRLVIRFLRMGVEGVRDSYEDD
jgi:4,5:9,10-diseco-3-hydroxy-5,9,17-trioxoandrosta-1(10),2-diene-4-oate hydrolase